MRKEIREKLDALEEVRTAARQKRREQLRRQHPLERLKINYRNFEARLATPVSNPLTKRLLEHITGKHTDYKPPIPL